jgi:DNA-binding SARP family transcriptional activator
VSAAHSNVARGLAYLGRWDEARAHIEQAIDEKDGVVEPEVICEAAELETMFGDPERGASILDRAFSAEERRRDDPFCRYVAARIALEHGESSRARELLGQIGGDPWVPGFRSARLALDLQLRATEVPCDPELQASCDAAEQFALRQQAWLWWRNSRLTRSLVSQSALLGSHLHSLEQGETACLSIQAGLILRRLGDLDEEGVSIVGAEASRRPERWRWALRRFLSSEGRAHPSTQRAVALLERVGEIEDVVLLGTFRKRKSLHLPEAGRTLSRRLAPRLYVEDLGRVIVRVGDRVVAGTDIRKKVLSLLCYLLTRPQFTATREQVLEALWPEMDPEAGANSLNQSSYFLRRVLQPGCQDDANAGYLRSRADLIWLDPELVNSRSAECGRLIDAIRGDPTPALVAELAQSYTSRFAVDFTYDDWASTFRDTLHASFLDRIERAIAFDTKAGAFDRAISIAQSALHADPDADQIELSLLRLYRRTGANAAAAEQYVHYANVMRDQLGVDPPPLESL